MANSIPQFVERATKELIKMTGLELSSILGATKHQTGWKISVEMVEKHSIPDQMDILAVYEAILDAKGNLTEFKRKGLRKRLDTDTSE